MGAYGAYDLERMEPWRLLMDNNWSFTSRVPKHEDHKNWGDCAATIQLQEQMLEILPNPSSLITTPEVTTTRD